MKKGILFVLAAAFLASCQQEEENGVVSSVDRVTITPIITRTVFFSDTQTNLVLILEVDFCGTCNNRSDSHPVDR